MASFYVDGTPAPKGSLRRGQAGQLYPASPHLEAWTKAVANAAARYWAESDEWTIAYPVEVRLDFILARPQSHIRPDGSIRPIGVMAWPKVPDLDKLCRSTLDALVKGGLLEDDAQVVALFARKRYGPRPGCDIHVSVVTP